MLPMRCLIQFSEQCVSGDGERRFLDRRFALSIA